MPAYARYAGAAAVCLFAVTAVGVAQPTSAAASKPAVAANVPGQQLDNVLSRMDNAAATFKSAEADFQWNQYTKVVDDTDVQKGHIFFRRSGKNLEVAIQITSPAPKYIVYRHGKVSMYEPNINQLTEREAGKNQSDVEAFMGLGFGARGHDLLKSYDVKLEAWETVDGVNTARLALVPKAQQLRSMFSRILLWVDPSRDVLMKQQFFEPSEDYRLTLYSNIKLNTNIPAQTFEIKTAPGVKKVKP